ncbi:hypothetical protein OOT00_01815 [Desulfobotulus sp. H1]|uniref:MarR family transcriptional regulator n=1 Tax=Desulfobotulus pelophilus TaxID=2823377 RepID=A0ABT3N5I6_9BACT|nr:hypothetical protein [Desulfobotulus pelophilus]MCW7752720.1 hypothetical protein [Desulfobotulus pelophilus]
MKFDTNPMRQEIFTLGLEVDVISAYLCCCGLAADGALSRDRLLHVWNQDEGVLDMALAVLEARNIVTLFRQEKGACYQIHPPEQWLVPV